MRAFPLCHRRHASRQGFSLVELLVCIAIIAIISTVILARYRSFNSTILLRNLAYEIALSTREAQVLGIGVRGSSGTFTHAYGMHFTRRGTTYMLFADLNGNNRYDSEASPKEELSVYTIGQKNEVTDLCTNATCGLATLDVLFRRPNPDALFYPNPTASSVRVVVGAPGTTNTRTVRVWPTGQIAIE